MPGVVVHGQTHRPDWVGGSDPVTPIGYYEYKLYLDPGHPYALLDPTLPIVQVGNAQWSIGVPRDLDGSRLVHCFAFVSVAGAVTVQLRRIRPSGGTVTLLSTPITIDGGEKSSYLATTPPLISPANSIMQTADEIVTDVTAADGTAAGLAVGFVLATV